MRPQVSETKPDGLPLAWHYTTEAACQSILRSQEIWATASNELNDATEVEGGRQAVADVCRGLEGSGISLRTNSGELLDSNQFGDREYDLLRRAVERVSEPTIAGSIFVCSASLLEDSLTQWKHYGRDEGWALGFDPTGELTLPEETREETKSPSARQVWREAWTPVSYSLPQYRTRMAGLQLGLLKIRRGLLAKNAAEAEPLGDDVVEVIWSLCSEAGLERQFPLLKHAAFEDERETRYVVRCSIEDRVQHRVIGGRTSRYIRLISAESTGPDVSQRRPLPIRALLAGPGVEDDSVAVMRTLVDECGLRGLPIRRTEIPFRTRKGSKTS